MLLFHGQEHRPFHWSGGKRAALLVHGFPGTAAELRPLGRVLHKANWTVRGMLLPGFGPDIETLADRNTRDWLAAIKIELTALRRQHPTVMLIGYSMG
ncbi:MAG: esterase, partial [Anaerolineae bacterium]|nr:esterase [Anaerolineae bacterium]